ncbi:MAG: hypothetical protein QXG05_08195 [Nitrososphaerota archaeon]
MHSKEESNTDVFLKGIHATDHELLEAMAELLDNMNIRNMESD